MNIYKESIKFKLHGNDFIMYNSKNGKKAFLKIINDKYYYPSLEELVEIVALFNNHDTVMFYEDTTNVYNNHKVNNRRNRSSKSKRFIPKVICNIRGVAVAVGITAGLAAAIASSANVKNTDYLSVATDIKPIDLSYDYVAETYPIANVNSDNKSYYDDEDISILYDAKYVSLYSNKYYSEYLEIDEISPQEIIDIINNNENLDENFKNFTIDFYTKMKNYYGDGFDDRVFAKNVETLKVVYKADSVSAGSTALATYDYEANVITLLEDFDYNDELSKLIVRHELCHATNSYLRDSDSNSKGYKVKSLYCSQGSGSYASEAMNVIFSTNPFLDEYSDKLKENMGYGITTNALRVVIDCTNYDVSDSTRHNINSLKDATSEFLPEGVDSEMFYDLMDAQTVEELYSGIEMDDSDSILYYTILSNMYINKNINTEMSYDEITGYKNEFIDSLYMGLGDTDVINISAIDDTFNVYLNENNIGIGKTK